MKYVYLVQNDATGIEGIYSSKEKAESAVEKLNALELKFHNTEFPDFPEEKVEDLPNDRIYSFTKFFVR